MAFSNPDSFPAGGRPQERGLPSADGTTNQATASENHPRRMTLRTPSERRPTVKYAISYDAAENGELLEPLSHRKQVYCTVLIS